MVARGGQHALYLMVFSLFQYDFNLMRVNHAAADCRQRCGFVMQFHTAQQLGYKFWRYLFMRGCNIDLGDVSFG